MSTDLRLLSEERDDARSLIHARPFQDRTNIVGIAGTAPWQGCFQPTGSSEATIAEARKAAKAGEALNVLTWGGETDLAQAPHDGPSIAPPVRLSNIAGRQSGDGSGALLDNSRPVTAAVASGTVSAVAAS